MTKEDIHNLCYDLGISSYIINPDMSIDVNGDVAITQTELTKLPLKFGRVDGWFDCYSNRLTTLEGSPHTVTKGFYCHNNKLTTLEYCPKVVEGNFSCQSNDLISNYSECVVGDGFYTSLREDGLTFNEFDVNNKSSDENDRTLNYDQWCKNHKRSKTIKNILNKVN